MAPSSDSASPPLLERLWYGSIKPMLNVPTTKKLVILDWRLGLMYRVLQLGVLFYLLVQIFVFQLYELKHLPKSTLTLYAEAESLDPRSAREMLFARANATELCSHEGAQRYGYTWSSGWEYSVNGCKARDLNFAFRKASPSSAFIPTYEVLKYSFSSPAPAALATSGDGSDKDEGCSAAMNSDPALHFPKLGLAGCAPARDRPRDLLATTNFSSVEAYYVPTGDPTEESFAPECVCEAQQGVMIPGIELVQLVLNHETFILNSRKLEQTRTYLRVEGSDENHRVIEDESVISLSVGDVLNWTGIELDRPANEGGNKQWMEQYSQEYPLRGPSGISEGRYPYPRMTGLSLTVRLEYYNDGRAPASEEPQGTFDFLRERKTECVAVLKPVIQWTSRGAQVTVDPVASVQGLSKSSYTYGIDLNVESSGEVSTFDFPTLVSTLVNAIVLSGAVGVVVIFVAQNLLSKDRKTLFQETLTEKLDIPEMYKQFAIKSLVSSMAFDRMDGDRSGCVDKEELYKALRDIYKNDESMGPTETATLVEFLLYRTAGGSAQSAVVEQKLEQEEQQGEKKTRGRSRSASFLESIAQMKRLRQATNSHVTRDDWVSSFNGAPCSVPGFARLVQRKTRQGHYKLSQAAQEEYMRWDKDSALKGQRQRDGKNDSSNGPHHTDIQMCSGVPSGTTDGDACDNIQIQIDGSDSESNPDSYDPDPVFHSVPQFQIDISDLESNPDSYHDCVDG